MSVFSQILLPGALSALFLSAVPVPAQTLAQGAPQSAAAPPNGSSAPTGFIGHFLARVSATQAEQPHWVTPLVTVTPRLEQELRADFLSQPQANHTRLWNYGNGKGLEVIPERRIELIFNVPAYLQHNSSAKDGFGDVSFLMKYRFYARNEEHGNAIITGFIAGTYPTGSYLNGARNATVSPTLAVGKGFGAFDVQSTLGATLPTAGGNTVGRPIAWNTALQYHRDTHFWPEVEFNTTYFKGGPDDGKIQNFITPGIVYRHKLHNRIGITLGAGIQLATSGYHSYDHGIVTSARMPF